MDAASWRYTLKSTMQRFSANQATDMAATLTYYTVLAMFPALLSLVSILKLSSVGDTLMPALTQMIAQAVPDEATAGVIVDIIEGFFSSSGAGLGLAIGVLTAAWSASGYIAALSRAMNRIYQVEEGRNSLALKVQQFGLTIVVLVSMAVLVAGLVLSGGVASWLGDLVGFGEGALAVWGIAKWPVMLALVMMLIAVLYHFSPNVKLPRFRPVSYGSIVAVLVAIIAVAGFSFYAVNFSSYDATYGALAGLIIGLWLLWLTNVAIVLGAHLDMEVLRTKQLLAGAPSEREADLEPRQSAGILKQTQKDDRLAAQGHELRGERSED